MLKANGKQSRIFIGTVLIYFLLSWLPAAGAFCSAETQSTVEAHYFYENPCASCDKESEIIDRYKDILAPGESGLPVTLYMHNSFRENEKRLLEAFYDEHKVPQGRRNVPALFLDEKYCIGESDIDKNFADLVRVQTENSGGINSGKGILAEDGKKREEHGADKEMWVNAQGLQTVVYFFVTACEDCTRAKKALDQPENGGVAVEAFNIAQASNLEALKRYYDAYGVPSDEQIVPIVFAGNRYFAGADAIAGSLKQALQEGLGFETLNLLATEKTAASGAISIDGYTVAGVVTTGLINGLNPCSLSMLLLFLSTLMAKSAYVARFALSFIAGKFIAYMALGTVAYEMLSLVNEGFYGYVRLITKAVLLGAALLLVVSNMADYHNAKKEKYHRIILQLPAAVRRMNHRWIRELTCGRSVKVLVFLSFGLGVLISLGEFLCTGQIFLAGILYVNRAAPFLNLRAWMYFTLYVLAMLTPLLLVTVLVWRGRGIFEVSEAIRKRMPAIKLANAVVFLIFSLVAIFLF